MLQHHSQVYDDYSHVVWMTSTVVNIRIQSQDYLTKFAQAPAQTHINIEKCNSCLSLCNRYLLLVTVLSLKYCH